MSIVAIAAVFQLDLPPLSKWVLVCLADNADNFGGNIFPTITTLSQKSSIPERTLQRHLKSLVESRILEVVRIARRPSQGKPGRGTEYRLSFMTNPMASAPRPNYRSCPPKLRIEVIEAFQETCAYCGRKGNDKDPDGQAWHVDRIIPGSRGGAYAPENIALSCGKCNIRKGATMAPVPAMDLGAKRIEMGANEFDTGANSPDMGATRTAHDPSLEPPREPSVKEPSAANGRGTPIPKDFSLTGGMREWGAQETPHVDLDDALKEFIDYWSDIAGKAGVKLSWDGTWRNRMRELEKRATRNGNGHVPKFDPARNSAERTAPRPQLPAPTVTDEELASLNITD